MIFKNKQKKGQAALEFLTTYGWAFLVILVMIGALAYFGVLDPQKFLPNRCQFQTGINCEKYILDSTAPNPHATLQLKNGLGQHLFIAGMDYYNASAGDYVPCTNPTINGIAIPTVFNKGQVTDFVCEFDTNVILPGEKTKVEFRYLYNIGSLADAAYQTYMYGEVYMEAR